jgi:excisionase family DNA binding protein
MATDEQTLELTSKKRGRPAKKPRNIAEQPVKRERVSCSVKESAALLDIGVTKLYEKISAGEIESFCIGSRRLMPYRELLAFVERQL